MPLYYQLTEREVRLAKTYLGVPMSFWEKILRELAASNESEAYVRLLPFTNYLKARSSLNSANRLDIKDRNKKICDIFSRRDQQTNTFILTKRGTVP